MHAGLEADSDVDIAISHDYIDVDGKLLPCTVNSLLKPNSVNCISKLNAGTIYNFLSLLLA